MDIQKNDLVELSVTGLTSEGKGIGKVDSFAVFVPASCPGDLLRVRIIKREKNYAVGKIEEVLSPSKDRITSLCPAFPRCGGCDFCHMSYSFELSSKEARVREAIARIGSLPPELVAPIVAADSVSRYRNKAQIPVGISSDGEPVMGFYGNHSHRIIPCGDCLLQPEGFSEAERIFLEWVKKNRISVFDEASGKGCVRHLYLRKAFSSGDLMVCIVASCMPLHIDAFVLALREAFPLLKSVILNLNSDKTNVVLGKKSDVLWGSPFIADTLCGLSFRLSPASFYQVNSCQAEKLYKIAAQYADISPAAVLLDLYCGTGTIGLTMAKKAKNLIGVEIIPDAVRDANENAARNGITNAEFLCGDAAAASALLYERRVRPDVITIDPPRKGCDAALIKTVCEMNPNRIVYLSCDPATLARDLKIFAQLGYPPVEITPVDMFPRTANVECAALLMQEKDHLVFPK